MFLTKYPNGDVTKSRCLGDGYKAHTRCSTKKTIQEIVPLSSDDKSGAEDVAVIPVEASPPSKFLYLIFHAMILNGHPLILSRIEI